MRSVTNIFILWILLCISLQTRAIDAIDIALADYPPYEFSQNNEFEGISVKLVKAIFEEMKQPINLSLLPWSRGLKFLKEGQIDGFFQVLVRPERHEYIDYSQVVLIDELVSLFVVEDSIISFNGDFSALSQYRFGARKDFSYGTIYDGAVEDKVITKLTIDVETEHLIRKLCTGELDIVIGDQYAIYHLFNQKMLIKMSEVKRCKKIRHLSPNVQSMPAYMAFSKKRQLSHIRDKFDLVLAEMQQDGRYKKIIETWNKSQ
ncbi:transporter substrate-binding domain-containing protein [Shewanella sp. VB17]|uniref:substrate-binding periplasmic protein n=1 Tax=Shewanella sp. VB17 TaxID=2739432 RepID=UPI001566D1E4|nr:transporter substrate-binding domain-containing protein [Shewanella sp. VB17]NRD75293.1 transporter substrate-binding domain-containing protein [Shewanella sp. VB17]